MVLDARFVGFRICSNHPFGCMMVLIFIQRNTPRQHSYCKVFFEQRIQRTHMIEVPIAFKHFRSRATDHTRHVSLVLDSLGLEHERVSLRIYRTSLCVNFLLQLLLLPAVAWEDFFCRSVIGSLRKRFVYAFPLRNASRQHRHNDDVSWNGITARISGFYPSIVFAWFSEESHKQTPSACGELYFGIGCYEAVMVVM
jgi:hypothetical protein